MLKISGLTSVRPRELPVVGAAVTGQRSPVSREIRAAAILIRASGTFNHFQVISHRMAEMSQLTEISALTSLRGVAALTVLIFHIIPDFRGYLAVDLFFLLSGFVLTHVYNTIELNRKNYLNFLKARLARIYPVHWIILIVLLPMLDTRPDFSSGGLLSSVLLLQSPWHPMCWNYASWSISAEWHSYLLFPILVTNYRARSNKVLLTTLAVCAGVVGLNDLNSGSGNISNTIVVLLRCLPEFISGIVLYFLWKRECLPKWICRDITFWVSVAMLLLFERIYVPDGLMVCMLGMLLLTSAANHGRRSVGILNWHVFAYLGYISYSLYMVQMVVALVLMFYLPISPSSILYKILFIGLCFLSAAIISPTIEYPARNWLKRISWRPYFRSLATR
jgi:peptidoglycan/LPS O-acetylase OafA/YrhL